VVQLIESDIQTREVLDWQGVHLFHFPTSSCSQKTRIILNLKGVEWESHIVDLSKNENFDPWYLGINPRGLVPTLVINGAVHIESNDIITLLDKRFPEPRLIPRGFETRTTELLAHEDDLHLDLRTLSFRFLQRRNHPPKSADALERYRAGGSGTVSGETDRNKPHEIAFWESIASEGFTDAAVRTSARRFKTAIDGLESGLQNGPYLLGDRLSVLDVAWFVYLFRLVRVGYPLARLHPRVAAWLEPLRNLPEFANEVRVPPKVQKAVEENQRAQHEAGTTFLEVSGL